MTKLKASGLHLLISLMMVTLIISLMLFLWYPGAYFKLMGGKELFYLISGVDVFLGPILTLVVFKSGKKTLKFDLACIAIVQVLAMSYGVYVMFQARPVFTVFNKTSFQVLSVLDIDARELALGKRDEWRTLSMTGTRLVAIGEPDKKNKKEAMFAKVASLEAGRYPRLYDDYKNHQTEAVKAAKPLAELIKISASNEQIIDKFIRNQKRPASDFLFLPAESMVNEMVAIIDAKTGEFVKIIDANPAQSNLAETK